MWISMEDRVECRMIQAPVLFCAMELMGLVVVDDLRGLMFCLMLVWLVGVLIKGHAWLGVDQ